MTDFKSFSMRLFLNKRLIRAAVAAFLFLTAITFAAYWRRHPDDGLGTAALLPLLGWRSNEPQEFFQFESTSRFFPISQDIEGKTTEELCSSFPSHITKRIQPVLKIGHGDKRAKTEAQLSSVSACFTDDELLIFSDLDENISNRTVIDILADLPEVFRSENPDFENYITMQDMRRNGTLDVDKAATAAIDGWGLDKYKFIPMVERAWSMRTGRDWYVFYETDTYVVWDNVFRFLSALDPNRPLYMGSPSPGRFDEKKKIKTWFANGGPGFILSRAAMEKLLYRKSQPTGQFVEPPLNIEWRDLLRHDCCGDSVLGWSLWKANVPLSGFYPLFNPWSLHGIPYSERFWCQPVLTLHRTTPDHMVKMWRWEHSRRTRKTPLLYSHVSELLNPGTPSTLTDWDNGDLDRFEPPNKANVDSFESCGQACRDHPDCLQWLWRGQEIQECMLMRTFRYGEAREPGTIEDPPPEEESKEGPPAPRRIRKVDYKSGWVKSRIDEWRSRMECAAPQWVTPSITRIY